MCLFDKYNIASLGKKEMGIFNSRAELIIEAVLPPSDIIPEQERKELMDCRDREEEIHDNCITNEDIDNIFGQELRRAIKTVEVMGLIIKNRAGSMEKKKLKEIFEEGMHVHLRILSSFLEIIYKEENEDCIVEYISDRVKEIESERKINNSERKLSNNEIRKFSRIIFWNINFLVVYGVIYKIVHSLGSENLIEIIEDVCDKENTIASTVVKHGILMWYNKNLQIEEIVKVLRRDDMSIIPDRVIRLMISEFCRFHPIPYKDRQKLERKLGYSSKGLLENRYVETF